MFDHVAINVRDFDRSRAFYEQALAPLGYRVAMDMSQYKAVAFGTDEKPTFWVCEREPYGTGTHVAFAVDDHETVHAFHDAALAAGGTTTARPARARSTRRRTTQRSSTTSTATTSRPSAIAARADRRGRRG